MRLLPGRRGSGEASRVLAGAASAAAATTSPVLADPHAAAFFDVDNTVLAGASIFHFARGLASRNFFTSRDLARFAGQQLAFRLRGEDPAHMDAAREAALAFATGHRADTVAALGEEVYDERLAPRVYDGTVALARRHLERGQRVWLVTATPVELATVLSRRLGLTGALGTVSEIVDGVYTGRLVGKPLHGPAKAEAVRALARREDLDLRRCSAYSDSINDVPMLTVVGHPVAVNPDPALRRYARTHGWPVHDFRHARTAAKFGLPTAMGLGAVSGGVAAGLAVRRRRSAAAGSRLLALPTR